MHRKTNQPQQVRIHNFTTEYPGIVNVIATDVAIAPQANLGTPNVPQVQTQAIWDTGATGTVITKKVAQALNLKPTGITRVQGVNGVSMKNTYIIMVRLPNNVTITHIEATECDELNGPFEVLIGMNIIAMGDFVVTNSEGKTVFSFRIPSVSRIDFTNPQNNKHVVDDAQMSRTERRALERARRKKRK